MDQAPKRRSMFGLWALVTAVAGLLTLSFLPTPYVIQRPGPVYDTLGSASASDGTQVPLIHIDGAETYPAEGALNLTTVQMLGNRERPPTWVELALAWGDPSRAIVPMDHVFPEGVTTEDRNQYNASLMDESRHEATAAALRILGYEVPAQIEIVELSEDSVSAGVLQAGDMLTAFNGTPLTSTTDLRARLQENGAAVVRLALLRDGEALEVDVTPGQSTAGQGSTWVIGAYVRGHYDFPLDVTIQLDNVGGSSAGLMFALGIVDYLTPGSLTGGEIFAGTGTIDAEGTVGPIGGIRQKLYGARDAGATYFFAPASNCAEVVGHVPDGLSVFRVETIDDALGALEVIAQGEATTDLATCALP